MAKKFAELRNKMSPERQARSKARTDQMLLELSLKEIRQQMSDLSQDDVAELLEVTQGYVSRIERQKDLSVRRLYEYVATLGGEVEILARFPEGREVKVSQFDKLDSLQEQLEQKEG